MDITRMDTTDRIRTMVTIGTAATAITTGTGIITIRGNKLE
jgi:hypothetical protein